jgi:hypothetical protein
MVVFRVFSSSNSPGNIFHCHWSLEIIFNGSYPQGLQNLLDRIERMRGYGPEFIDITW